MVNILIAEDEIIVARDIQMKLEKLGYTIIDIVSTGETAITTAEKKQPNLVPANFQLN